MAESNILYAIVLGIIQGISEFLPISSSGHLIIFSNLTSGKSLSLALNVALHFGTLLAILIFFKKDWFKIFSSVKEFATERKKSFESHVLLPALIIGSIPAAVVGLAFKDQIESYFHSPMVVAIPLILVGIVMVFCDKFFASDKPLKSLTLKDGVIIGLAQAVALIPGTSRSGITISAGRALRFSKIDAARFSFLLGTPAMGGAFLLEARDILDYITDPVFYVGIISSFFVGLLTMKFLFKFLQKFGFLGFAIYRIAIALIIIFI
jgi:undecaprenyl-diphosphatase